MTKTKNNQRIFKNSLFLYFRMILTLGVSLYTSRVILNTLGVEDFGILNVVGGVVTMMAFLSGAMSSATQRFLSFELGKNDTDQLHNVFKMSINIHLLIIIFVVLVVETLGLWFINTHLVIPAERLAAANFVFHCALFSFCCTIIAIPFNAAIIAYEKMSAFAYISIIDVMLKLVIVLLLATQNGDKLKIYALLLALVSVMTLACYYIYARLQFAITRFSWYWNPQLFKTLFSYTGWNLFGNLAVVMSIQGVNILLNMFFGAYINASRAIAMQVNGAIVGFVGSLQMSINPQIIKAYAVNDKLYMNELVFSGAKYASFLLLLLSLPVFIEIEFVLNLWLENVPQFTDVFVRLVLIDSFIICLSCTLMTSAQATGKIKFYQIVVGGIQLLNIPLSYFFLSQYSEPVLVYYVSIFISIIALLARMFFLRALIDLSIKEFVYKVIMPSLKVLTLSFFVVYFLFYACDLFLANNFLFFIMKVMLSFTFTFCIIYFFGLNYEESKYILNLIRKKMLTIKRYR